MTGGLAFLTVLDANMALVFKIVHQLGILAYGKENEDARYGLQLPSLFFTLFLSF